MIHQQQNRNFLFKMIYDLNNPEELGRCKKRLNLLAERKARVEVKEARKSRTNDQNRYIHKLFQILADEIGDTLESLKFDAKIELGFYRETANGNKMPESTATMDTKRMTEFIDRFRMFSESFHGVYLPTSEEWFRNEL